MIKSVLSGLKIQLEDEKVTPEERTLYSKDIVKEIIYRANQFSRFGEIILNPESWVCERKITLINTDKIGYEYEIDIPNHYEEVNLDSLNLIAEVYDSNQGPKITFYYGSSKINSPEEFEFFIVKNNLVFGMLDDYESSHYIQYDYDLCMSLAALKVDAIINVGTQFSYPILCVDISKVESTRKHLLDLGLKESEKFKQYCCGGYDVENYIRSL